MRSDALKKGLSRAPARAMLRATGLGDAELDKPLVAVISTWTDVMPCNLHLRDAGRAKCARACARRARTPVQFNTIAVSDGIAMGTDGMEASLVSREVIADSMELAALGHLVDGVVGAHRLRQDHPGGGDGDGAARSAVAAALRRADRAGALARSRRHHPGRLRSGRRAARPASSTRRSCASSSARPVPAPARAAGSSPPTRWRWR